MRAFSTLSLVFLGGSSLLYGCHKLAGVVTDGVLDTGNAGGSGGGGASGSGSGGGGAGGTGTGGAGGVGGAGGSGGGGFCDPTVCLSNACDQGACVPVKADCAVQGVPFNVFVPSDFGDPDTRLMVSYSSKAVYVAMEDEAGTLNYRARSIDAATTNVSPITSCPSTSTKGKMYSARASETEFVLQGAEYPANPAVTEVHFGIEPTNGKLTGACSLTPMAAPACVSRLQNLDFVHINGVTKYSATCEDPANSSTWRLFTGGSDEPSYKDIASGPNTDNGLRTSGLALIKNERVVFVGPKLFGQIGYRRESDGFVFHPIETSTDPARVEAIFGGMPAVAGESAYLMLGSGLPPPQFEADLYGALITDLSQLDAVPPTGARRMVHFAGADVAKLGTYGQAGQAGNFYYVGVAPLSEKSADIFWYANTAEMLIAGQSVYTVPAGDATTITRVQFVPLGTFGQLVVWREENAGAVTVRAQKLICSYSL